MEWKDDRLVSLSPFIPHNFDALHKKRNILPTATEEQYKNGLQRFHAITDVSIERIEYKSDGLTVNGVLLMPKNLQPGKHPILIYNRGGSGDFGILTVWILVLLAGYARDGYIIFASNYRGNDGGKGKDEFGGADVNDVLTLLDMARNHPAWDGKNTYMYGHSRGGMMTFLVLKKGAQLNAAVAVAGPTYLERLEEERDDMLPIYRKYIPHFDENREAALGERAVMEWVDVINTPLLLLHGDADDRVDVSHSIELDKLLTAKGKAHKTVIYPAGTHSLFNFAKAVKEEITAWFAQYKKD